MAFVQKSASKNSQTAFLHLQRNEVLLSVVILIISFVFWHPVYYLRPMIQFASVAARQAPQTSVVFCCVLQRNPEPKQSIWLSVEVGGVLMNIHLSSYSGWFENGHGLYDEWVGYASFLADLRSTWSICDVFEEFVVLMESMSYFVDRLFFGYNQLSIFECLRLKEEAHFVR